MERVSITQVIKNFSAVMHKLCGARVPMLITHKKKPSAIMLSMEDYYALESMVYFLDSSKCAAKLMQAYAENGSSRFFKPCHEGK